MQPTFPGPISIYQWVCASPGNPWASPSPQAGQEHKLCDPWTLQPETPGPTSTCQGGTTTHQWGDTSPRTIRAVHPAISGPIPQQSWLVPAPGPQGWLGLLSQCWGLEFGCTYLWAEASFRTPPGHESSHQQANTASRTPRPIATYSRAPRDHWSPDLG